ncbi:MAG: DMT family transporter [Alphaproteobacteria bacterium]|nr:DMT family transporter [Alphaproteobacteria bacterium]
MSWAWIPITLSAALFQALRTALQRRLKSQLSTNGATFTRFLFGLPLAAIYLVALRAALDETMPTPNPEFWAWLAIGGLAQILATSALILSLSLGNFAVGTAYSKTEVIQVAVFEALFLGLAVSIAGAGAIAVASIGVMLMSLARLDRPLAALRQGLTQPATLYGLGSGALFAIAAVGFRGASLSLGHPQLFLAAAFTLAFANLFQTLVMAAWLSWREPGQIALVRRHWRPAAQVGVLSFLGSGCWFTAMAIQQAAYVRTLGLVELVFSLAISFLAFRERPRRAEIAGMALIAVGVAVVLNQR